MLHRLYIFYIFTLSAFPYSFPFTRPIDCRLSSLIPREAYIGLGFHLSLGFMVRITIHYVQWYI